MASDSKEELNSDQPPAFVSQETKTLFIRYQLDGKNPPKFSYILLSSAGPAFDADGRDQSEWSPYLIRERFVQLLDISIDRDTTIIVETANPGDFYWSLTDSAIKTKEKKTHLYGDLLYRDGSVWKERGDFDTKDCIAVSFKAKFNTSGKPEKHKFSYFVRYRDENQVLKEYEIDPDIKNPSQ